jgi:hypothetical protein
LTHRDLGPSAPLCARRFFGHSSRMSHALFTSHERFSLRVGIDRTGVAPVHCAIAHVGPAFADIH